MAVEWDLPYNSLEIEETTEIGVYDVRGVGQGSGILGSPMEPQMEVFPYKLSLANLVR
ncbi:MAG: hypothetical protein Ct9H90mP16_14410 [Candidatus Poseidoniales archaeon]|nr:MAG: hypothetical protein Ct9H90mP16_14410 [Candidatus Poseidoniales archaeon]